MKPLHALIALMMLACCLAVPVLAQNSYSGIDVWQENAALMKEKYVMPAPDQNEIDSMTNGALFISVSTRGCIDERARQIRIAPYDADPVIEAELGVNGLYDTRLPAGKYQVVLPIGQGSDVNQPNTWKQETTEVTIIPGQRVDVNFIGAGQACGAGEEPAATCKIVITRAQYGDIDCHTEEVCEDVSNEVTQWLYFSHGTWHVRCNNPAHSGTHHLQFTCNHGTHEACHDEEVCTGSNVDVTANVKEAVNKGYSSFVFRNDRSPGGIFNTGSTILLSTIADPAPGQVKTVTITYSKCGVAKTITAAEYTTITL